MIVAGVADVEAWGAGEVRRGRRAKDEQGEGRCDWPVV